MIITIAIIQYRDPHALSCHHPDSACPAVASSPLTLTQTPVHPMLPPHPFLEWNLAEVTVRGAVREACDSSSRTARAGSGCLGELGKEASWMLLNVFS